MLKEEALLYPPFILVLTTKKGEQYAIDCDKQQAVVQEFNDSKNSVIWLSDYGLWISRFDIDDIRIEPVWDKEVIILKQLQKRIAKLSDNKQSSLSFKQFLWKSQEKPSLN